MDKQHDLRALARGTELAGYVIGNVVGRGGFGITYAATRPADGQRLAIKEYAPRRGALRRHDDSVVPWPAADRGEFDWGRRQFRHEARLLQNLDHPNVVRARGLFGANGTDYMVMDYYEGRSLADIVDDVTPLAEGEVRAMIDPVCDALRYLHQQGVIHRDLKPEHIIVQPDGVPVLIDFGAAISAQTPTQMERKVIASRGYSPFELYSSGLIEQGPWTDLYALGATLYQLLSGAMPMDAPARREHLEATGVDPLVTAGCRLAGRYSSQLLAAIDQALALYPGSRPATVNAWRRALV